MNRRLLPLLAMLLGAAAPDPDWPCQQRLMPVLAGGTLWAGHGTAADWRTDPAVAALVARVSPRGRSPEEAAAELAQFTAALPPADRAAAVERAFSGLVEETNAQRTQIIERLHDIARRQRALVGTVAQVDAQLRALPADAPAADREEIVSRRGFLIRDYEAMQRTIRYACEAPVQLEARLGVFARTLQAGTER